MFMRWDAGGAATEGLGTDGAMDDDMGK